MNSQIITQVTDENLTRADKKQFWPRELLLGLLPLLIGFQLLVWSSYLPAGLRGIAVFRSFYTAGYMLRTHRALEIHDHEKHLELADELVPLGPRLNQGMDHPAYEALLFAPLSLLRYKTALAIFIAFNFGMVALCVRLLRGNFYILSQRWKPFPALLFLAFFPVTYAITGGNDSLILLALLAGSLVWIQSGKELCAGLLVGLGVFKFQVVIPIALLFLLWKRWRFALGFAITSTVAMCLSFLLVGVRGAKQLATMLLGMSLNLKTSVDADRYAISPRTMLNLRGLLSAGLASYLGHWWLQGLVFAGSLVILVIVARCRPSMPLAIVAAALVSYHLNAPDAVVLIIPIGLCLCTNSVGAALAGTLALVGSVAAIAPLYGFVGAVPLLPLLFHCSRQREIVGVPG
jgi:hypothetical protein